VRAIIQRVIEASVLIDAKESARIGVGLLVLLGVEDSDTQEDAKWLVQKITQMRIFSDEVGKMNKSLLECDGELLIVSQFTLHASTKKGNRPSFIKAASPSVAIPLYEAFVLECSRVSRTKTGKFGADMKVSLINDGPVTIWLDSKMRE
jgi:D-aminoacyl-tRNA deacylase